MNKHTILLLLVFLAIIPVALFRDFTPDNELKYLSIADEAIENGHYFAFYNHGIPYADKPPMYLWVVMACKSLFGKHIMLLLSMLSIIPAFVSVIVMNRWVKKYYASTRSLSGNNLSSIAEEGIGTGTALILTTAYFTASMIVLRMDMMMTMFIILALYAFFRMYVICKNGSISVNSTQLSNYSFYRKFRFLQIMMPIYIFLSIFSKGAVGFIIPILCIAVFLLIKGELRTIGRYLGWKMWLILLSLCAIWFVAVFLDGGKEYLNNLVFNQTVNRAVNAFHHKKAFYYYGITFWYTAAPWSLLSIVTIIFALIKGEIKTDLEKFFLIIFLSTIIMLSAVSSKLEVYLLPCFTFLMYLTALLLQKIEKNMFVKISISIPIIINILIFIASLFMTKASDGTLVFAPPFAGENFYLGIKLWAPVQALTAIFLVGGVVSMILLVNEKINTSIQVYALTLFLFIGAVSFSIPELNSIIGMRKGCDKAMQLGKNNGIDNYSYYNFKAGENFDVYFKDQMQAEGASRSKIAKFSLHKTTKEELNNLSKTILIIEERDLKKDSLLRAVTDPYSKYKYGQFLIVPITK